jgi:hypothetical protein
MLRTEEGKSGSTLYLSSPPFWMEVSGQLHAPLRKGKAAPQHTYGGAGGDDV